MRGQPPAGESDGQSREAPTEGPKVPQRVAERGQFGRRLDALDGANDREALQPLARKNGNQRRLSTALPHKRGIFQTSAGAWLGATAESPIGLADTVVGWGAQAGLCVFRAAPSKRGGETAGAERWPKLSLAWG